MRTVWTSVHSDDLLNTSCAAVQAACRSAGLVLSRKRTHPFNSFYSTCILMWKWRCTQINESGFPRPFYMQFPSGWPLSRHSEIPWQCAALMPMLSGTHSMPVVLVLM